MFKRPTYNPTPLMERINKQLIQQGHLNAFAIADFGEGPILTYRKCHSRVSTLSVNLTDGKRSIKFSNHSKPPYLIALAQEKPDQPIFTVAYREAPNPVLEHGLESHITGQVLAFGRSPSGSLHTLAHALYLPEYSCVFASVVRNNSLLLEGNPELCGHLLTCGAMIDALLCQNKKEVDHENRTKRHPGLSRQ